jgi:Fur family transcriptional regulator, ferric uptake regulator
MANAHAEIHRTVRDRLDQNDQRYTSGRRSLVGALADTDGPITLPELIDLAPELAQSSAYRNLAVLEEVGVVRRLVHSSDHARYELAEDLTEHHHHLICEQCGAVRDVTLTSDLEERLDEAFATVSRVEGFTPTHHTIDLYGRCVDCSL